MALDAAIPASISWFRFEDVSPVSPQTEAVFAAIRGELGCVRNQQRAPAKPQTLGALGALDDAVGRDEQAVLTPRERELIALVVSVENRCENCVLAHAAALRGHGGDADWVAMIEVDYRRTYLTGRERALADYAIKVTRAPAEIDPTDLQPLRDAGVPEQGVLEAAAVAAYLNFSNRFNSTLGVRANAEALQAHR